MAESTEVAPLSPVTRSVRGQSGIDAHLDGLRSASATLVEALKVGHNVLMPGSSSESAVDAASINTNSERVSESRSSYVTHQLSNVSQIPRGEAWSSTIILQKEYMDARLWQSESKATQAKTQAQVQAQAGSAASSGQQGLSVAAGETKTKDSKAPSFFAWPEQSQSQINANANAQANHSELAVDAVSEPDAEETPAEWEGWTRTENGWLNASQNLFYSDAEIIQAVRNDAAASGEPYSDGVDGEEEEEESSSSGEEDDADDADANIYCTEAEDEYRWDPQSYTQPSRRYGSAGSADALPKSRAAPMAFFDGQEASGWVTEYDSQCASALSSTAQASQARSGDSAATATSSSVGPVAGKASGMSTSDKIPICFSWNLLKDKNSKAHQDSSAPSKGSAGAKATAQPAPFGRNEGQEMAAEAVVWTSEYDYQFSKANQTSAPAPASAPVSAPAPAATSSEDSGVESAAGRSFKAPYGTDMPAPADTAWLSEYNDNFKRGGKVILSPPAAPSASNGAASAAKPTLRFSSESDSAFQWPLLAAGDGAAKRRPAQPSGKDILLPFPEKPMRTKAAPTPDVQEKLDAYFTTEFQACFRAGASASGGGASGVSAEAFTLQRAPPRGNKSNWSNPQMLEHVIVDVHPAALVVEKTIVVADKAAADTVAKVDASVAAEVDAVVDSGDGEGSLTAEEEVYVPEDDADSAQTSLSDPPSLIVRGKAIVIAQESYPVQKAAAAQELRPGSAAGGKAHLKGKALMFDKLRKASRTAALSHLANAKKGSGKASPLLKNRRWPSTSDAQNGRWKTESQSQFVHRKAPLQLL